jgi:hypothetical protein
MGHQNSPDGQHPNAMITEFRVLLDNKNDPMQSVAIHSSTCGGFKHMSCNKTYTQDEQLHAMELGICLGIKVPIEGIDGERISQKCQCTGIESWCGGDPRKDWVWVMQLPGRCYRALTVRLPWQLDRV